MSKKIASSMIYGFLFLFTLTLISTLVLSSSSSSAEGNSNTVNAAVHVLEACSIRSTSSDPTTPDNPVELHTGTYTPNINTTTLTVACNDNNGYSLYAVGYSNNVMGNTNMIGLNPANTIPTGLDTTANSSAWSFKLSTTDVNTTILEDSSNNSFSSNHIIPSTETKVATNTQAVDVTHPINLTTTYNVGIAPYQAPDTYTGKVKYTVVHPNYASEDGKVYMQDVTDQIVANIAEGEGGTFTDSRDGNEYTVKKINGQLWMTQNLRFTGTSVPAATSNVTTDAAMTYYSLDANDASYTDHCDSTNSYNYACIKDSGNTTTGVWYNYYAATAGTISGESNSTTATSDICPKNWHLPTGPNTTASTDINELVGNTASDWQDPTSGSGLTAFGAVAGGNYVNGLLSNTRYGIWWSATASYAAARYLLYYNSSNGQFIGTLNDRRNLLGNFVRCVYEDRTISDMTYMQDVTEKIAENTAEGASATLTDSRDGNEYTVKKINGQLWMTQNLRFTGTSVPTATSNVTADKTLTYYQLDTDGTSGGVCYSTNGYNYACIKDSGNATTGVWYNYYAATAGTISGDSNSTDATEDICPKNWHLPTGPNTTANTDFNKLVGNTTAGWQDPTSGLTAFGAVAGGFYFFGSLINTGYGFWWSATASDATYRYYLDFDSSNGQFRGSDNVGVRYFGGFVRCAMN